jgi:hypothetical protein
MKPGAILLSMLVLCQGCNTHSQCRRDLYQIRFAATVDAHLALLALDKGKIDFLRDHEIYLLGENLSELQKLMATADKDDRERFGPLGRTLLKHAESHKAELSRSRWALKMLKPLKALATDPANAKRVSELEEYVIAERKHLPILER